MQTIDIPLSDELIGTAHEKPSKFYISMKADRFVLRLNKLDNVGVLFDTFIDKQYCRHTSDAKQMLLHLKRRANDKNRENISLCALCQRRAMSGLIQSSHRSHSQFIGAILTNEQKNEEWKDLIAAHDFSEFENASLSNKEYDEKLKTYFAKKAYVENYKNTIYHRSFSPRLKELDLREPSKYQKIPLLFSDLKSPFRNQLIYAQPGAGKTAILLMLMAKMRVDFHRRGNQSAWRSYYVTTSRLAGRVEKDKWAYQYVIDLYNKQLPNNEKVNYSFDTDEVYAMSYVNLIKNIFLEGKIPVKGKKNVASFSSKIQRDKTTEQDDDEDKDDQLDVFEQSKVFKYIENPKAQNSTDYIEAPKNGDPLKNVHLIIDEFQTFYEQFLLDVRGMKKSYFYVLQKAVEHTRRTNDQTNEMVLVLSSATPISVDTKETLDMLSMLYKTKADYENPNVMNVDGATKNIRNEATSNDFLYLIKKIKGFINFAQLNEFDKTKTMQDLVRVKLTEKIQTMVNEDGQRILKKLEGFNMKMKGSNELESKLKSIFPNIKNKNDDERLFLYLVFYYFMRQERAPTQEKSSTTKKRKQGGNPDDEPQKKQKTLEFKHINDGYGNVTKDFESNVNWIPVFFYQLYLRKIAITTKFIESQTNPSSKTFQMVGGGWKDTLTNFYGKIMEILEKNETEAKSYISDQLFMTTQNLSDLEERFKTLAKQGNAARFRGHVTYIDNSTDYDHFAKPSYTQIKYALDADTSTKIATELNKLNSRDEMEEFEQIFDESDLEKKAQLLPTTDRSAKKSGISYAENDSSTDDENAMDEESTEKKKGKEEESFEEMESEQDEDDEKFSDSEQNTESDLDLDSEPKYGKDSEYIRKYLQIAKDLVSKKDKQFYDVLNTFSGLELAAKILKFAVVEDYKNRSDICDSDEFKTRLAELEKKVRDKAILVDRERAELNKRQLFLEEFRRMSRPGIIMHYFKYLVPRLGTHKNETHIWIVYAESIDKKKSMKFSDLWKLYRTKKNTTMDINSVQECMNKGFPRFKDLLMDAQKIVQKTRKQEFLEKVQITEFFGNLNPNDDKLNFSKYNIKPGRYTHTLDKDVINTTMTPAVKELHKNLKIGIDKKFKKQAIFCSVPGGAAYIASTLLAQGYGWIPILKKDRTAEDFDENKVFYASPDAEYLDSEPEEKNDKKFLFLTDDIIDSPEQSRQNLLKNALVEKRDVFLDYELNSLSMLQKSPFYAKWSIGNQLNLKENQKYDQMLTAMSNLIKENKDVERYTKLLKQKSLKQKDKTELQTLRKNSAVQEYIEMDKNVKKQFLKKQKEDKESESINNKIEGFLKYYKTYNVNYLKLGLYRYGGQERYYLYINKTGESGALKGLIQLYENYMTILNVPEKERYGETTIAGFVSNARPYLVNEQGLANSRDRILEILDFFSYIGLVRWAPKLTEDEKIAKQLAITEFFNNPVNLDGSQCQILLIDRMYYTGIDVYNTPTYHMLGTPLTEAFKRQARGRVIRYDGNTLMEENRKEGSEIRVNIREYKPELVGNPTFKVPTSFTSNVDEKKEIAKAKKTYPEILQQIAESDYQKNVNREIESFLQQSSITKPFQEDAKVDEVETGFFYHSDTKIYQIFTDYTKNLHKNFIIYDGIKRNLLDKYQKGEGLATLFFEGRLTFNSQNEEIEHPNKQAIDERILNEICDKQQLQSARRDTIDTLITKIQNRAGKTTEQIKQSVIKLRSIFFSSDRDALLFIACGKSSDELRSKINQLTMDGDKNKIPVAKILTKNKSVQENRENETSFSLPREKFKYVFDCPLETEKDLLTKFEQNLKKISSAERDVLQLYSNSNDSTIFASNDPNHKQKISLRFGLWRSKAYRYLQLFSVVSGSREWKDNKYVYKPLNEEQKTELKDLFHNNFILVNAVSKNFEQLVDVESSLFKKAKNICALLKQENNRILLTCIISFRILNSSIWENFPLNVNNPTEFVRNRAGQIEYEMREILGTFVNTEFKLLSFVNILIKGKIEKGMTKNYAIALMFLGKGYKINERFLTNKQSTQILTDETRYNKIEDLASKQIQTWANANPTEKKQEPVQQEKEQQMLLDKTEASSSEDETDSDSKKENYSDIQIFTADNFDNFDVDKSSPEELKNEFKKLKQQHDRLKEMDKTHTADAAILLEDYASLEEQYDGIRRKNQKLSEENKEFNQRLLEQEKTIKTLQHDYLKIQQDKLKVIFENDDLNSKIKKVISENDNLKDQIQKVISENDNLKDKIESKNFEIENIEDENSPLKENEGIDPNENMILEISDSD